MAQYDTVVPSYSRDSTQLVSDLWLDMHTGIDGGTGIKLDTM